MSACCRLSILAPVLAMLPLTGFVGCGGSGSNTSALPGRIDVKVWRVLATGDTVGHLDNFGCRLSDSDIVALVGSLRGNAFVFGGGTNFNWNGTITTFVNGKDQPNPFIREPAIQNLADWIEMAPGATWRSDSVNRNL